MLGELELSPVDIDWFSPGATHLLRMCSSGNLDLQTLRRACLFSLVAGETAVCLKLKSKVQRIKR